MNYKLIEIVQFFNKMSHNSVKIIWISSKEEEFHFKVIMGNKCSKSTIDHHH